MVIPESAVPWIIRHRYSNSPAKYTQEKYVAELQAEYDAMLPVLPDKVGSIIDIGCGVAGIDVLLKQRYPDADLYLLDGDGEEFSAGWTDLMLPFNSRDEAEKLLAVNGVSAKGWFDVSTKELLKADLIVSLASWGYHYPLSTYRVRGLCIADLRFATEGIRGTVLRKYKKRNLCAWKQK